MDGVYLSQPPAGYFLLAVMRKTISGWDWVALMVDIDPDRLKRWAPHRACWVRVPGRHRSYDSAAAAFDVVMATRH